MKSLQQAFHGDEQKRNIQRFHEGKLRSHGLRCGGLTQGGASPKALSGSFSYTPLLH